jgi:hypothetical protein
VSSERSNVIRTQRAAKASGSTPRRRAQAATQTIPLPAASRHKRQADREWRVSDDLPRPTPVGRAEIEALEVYLGAQIDDILRRMR